MDIDRAWDRAAVVKLSPYQSLIFDTCPAKYRFWSTGGRPKSVVMASFRFSSALHEAAREFYAMGDACAKFLEYWGRYKREPLYYKAGRDWAWYKLLGMKMVTLLEGSEYRELTPILDEKRLVVPYNDFDLVTQPDLVADVRNHETYIEFKTTDSPVLGAWVRFSDQITAGTIAVAHHLMVTPPVQALVCNFVVDGPNGGPDVQWFATVRTAADMKAYHDKLRIMLDAIERGEFPRRGLYSWYTPCGWCDYRGMCLAELLPPQDMPQMRQLDPYLDGV